MKRKFYILSFLVVFCAALFAQNVSDVSFYQEGKNIVVTYSLDKVANVSVQVSTDGGATYSAPLQKVSGDVGMGVAAGLKQIVWDVLSEYDSFTGDNVMFLVTAVGAALNGHDYVDLGLPSGLLWATCNVGATKPEEYGDYFAYGETSPKTIYDVGTYKYCKGRRTLESSDDAATVNWGSNWRMPTNAELTELREQCKWERMTINGVKGYSIMGKNGNSIFLPAAGWCYYDERGADVGKLCKYWSSEVYKQQYVYILANPGRPDYATRVYGLSIRPVLSPMK